MIAFLPLFAAFAFTGGLNDSQVLQREADGTAAPIVTGTSDGPGRLYCRIDDGRWSELTSVKAGDWKAQLPALPTGGPYTVHFRLDDASGKPVGEKSYREVFVGDLWVLAGQSNMVGRAKIDPSYKTDPRVRMLALDGKWQLATHPLHEQVTPPGVTRPGSALGLEFGKTMAAALNVPIGLLPCAQGGTSLAQWSPDPASPHSLKLYQRLLAQVRLAGGKVTGVLWYQGENDTGPEPSAVYRTKFKGFVAQLRTDLRRPDLPFYYAQLARFANKPAKFYAEWNAVQEAQRRAEAEIPHARMVATLDLEQGDHIHLGTESQDRLGRRFAAVALGKTGPRLADARWTSPNEIRLRLTGATGPLAAAGGRVFGFEATTADGQPRHLFFRVSLDAATGEVVLATNRDSPAREVPEAIDLWYGRGHDPICNLTDAADLALPAFGPLRLPPRPPLPPRKPAAAGK